MFRVLAMIVKTPLSQQISQKPWIPSSPDYDTFYQWIDGIYYIPLNGIPPMESTSPSDVGRPNAQWAV